MELELSVNVQYAGRRAESIREVLLQLNQPVWTRLVLRQVLPQLQQISPTEPEALTKLLHETALSKDKELSCSICMGVVDGLTAELPCGHKFHPNCARSWLERRSTCPLCRFQMPKAYTGTYAVAAVRSVLILPQEHQGLTPAQVLSLRVDGHALHAVVKITLVRVCSGAPTTTARRRIACHVSAGMTHANGSPCCPVGVDHGRNAKRQREATPRMDDAMPSVAKRVRSTG